MSKKIIILLLLILAVPILIFAVFYIRIVLKPEIDAEARLKAPGSFIELSNGIVHYELKGVNSQPVIVLIHGANIPSIVWDMNYNALVEAGYRVLRYDLFGRGFSDRPHIEYTKEVYSSQLYELLSRLNITGPVHIVGTSMGAAVAVFFTHAWPDRVASITLIDPFGPYSAFEDNNTLLRKAGKRLIDGILERNSITKRMGRIQPLREKMKEQMRYRGVGWSVFSTIRNNSYDQLLNAYKFVGEKRFPSQLIWGKDDEVIPFEYSKELIQLIPDITLHAIDNAGHVPHFEKPGIVNSILIDFFNSRG